MWEPNEFFIWTFFLHSSDCAETKLIEVGCLQVRETLDALPRRGFFLHWDRPQLLPPHRHPLGVACPHVGPSQVTTKCKTQNEKRKMKKTQNEKHKMKQKTRLANCKINAQLFHGLCQRDWSSLGTPTHQLCGNSHHYFYAFQTVNWHLVCYKYFSVFISKHQEREALQESTRKVI